MNRDELITTIGYLAEFTPKDWNFEMGNSESTSKFVRGAWKKTGLQLSLAPANSPTIKEAHNGKEPEDVPHWRGWLIVSRGLTYDDKTIELTTDEAEYLRGCVSRGRDTRRKQLDDEAVSDCWKIITSTIDPTEIAKIKTGIAENQDT